MQLLVFVYLLPANEALTSFSGCTLPKRTTPLLSSKTYSQLVGIRVVPNNKYSTELHLIPKQWWSSPRCSNRINSSDDNESEIPNNANSTVSAIDNDIVSNINAEDETLHSLGMKSGWANFRLSLLPSWTSATDTIIQSESTMLASEEMNYNIISSNGSNIIVPDFVDDSAVYDIEKVNALEYDEITEVDKNTPKNRDGIVLKLLRHTVAAILWGGKKLLFRSSLSPSESSIQGFDIRNSSDETISKNITNSDNSSSTELPVDVHNKTEVDVGVDDSLDNKERGKSRRRHLKNQGFPPILNALESIDINATTLTKQRRWERRRRRALVAYKVAKNAIFLFVVTFLAGNLINQFVDLDEHGSFEVHFGKVLSSSTPTTSTTPKSENKGKRSSFRENLFHSVVAPKPDLDGDRARALGLVSRAVKRIGPAVVRIETETYSDLGDGHVSNDCEDTGDVFDGFPETPRSIDFGQGSGIIINSQGYILTNAHVVDGATHVYVRLTDGRRFRAETQGADDIIDVAVLRIVPEVGKTDDLDNHKQTMMDNLPVAEVGNSDDIEVGTFVTAIGSPGGLDCSCTIGIVSGLKRCPKVVGIPDKFGVVDYIQTDAAINEGNSGGPLVDVESGTVIGINTCIRANMEGTSFAIPMNKIMGIVDDLSKGNHITHGYLGVHMSTMNPALARYYNKVQSQKKSVKIREREGVMIDQVFKNSPAQIGGLQKFDFITEIGGQIVEKVEDAHVLIDRAVIGEVLNVKVLRGDSEVVVQVKPEDLSPRLKQLRDERSQRKSTNKVEANTETALQPMQIK